MQGVCIKGTRTSARVLYLGPVGEPFAQRIWKVDV